MRHCVHVACTHPCLPLCTRQALGQDGQDNGPDGAGGPNQAERALRQMMGGTLKAKQKQEQVGVGVCVGVSVRVNVCVWAVSDVCHAGKGFCLPTTL